MPIQNEQLADKVVAAFKNNLSDETLSHISEQEFHELANIVREALSEELSKAAEMIDEVVKKLRGMTDHRDIDL